MTCEQATERLPWLLNGTLENDEEREVRQHLLGCGDCREALARTRLAWTLFAQHIPAEDLVAHAAGDEPGIDRGVLERHLLSCPQCAADLELVRTSRQLTEDEGVALFASPVVAAPVAPRVQPRPSGVRWWRSSALAAGLAGVVAATGWYHTSQELGMARVAARQTQTAPEIRGGGARGQASPTSSESPRIATLERQVGAGTRRIAELEQALQQRPASAPAPAPTAAAPGLHAATVQTLFGGQRDGGARAAVKVWADTSTTLKLASGNDTGTRVEIRREPQGKLVLGQGGLRFDTEASGYVVLLDAKALLPGHYTVRVLDAGGETIESYPLDVTSGRPPRS